MTHQTNLARLLVMVPTTRKMKKCGKLGKKLIADGLQQERSSYPTYLTVDTNRQ
jgi:hypothetical protein